MRVYRYKCTECGVEYLGGSWKPKDKRHCLSCSMKIIGEVCTQLREHQGPWYKAWKKGMKAAARRL